MELGFAVCCHWLEVDAEAYAKLCRPEFPQGVLQPHAMKLRAQGGEPDRL